MFKTILVYWRILLWIPLGCLFGGCDMVHLKNCKWLGTHNPVYPTNHCVLSHGSFLLSKWDANPSMCCYFKMVYLSKPFHGGFQPSWTKRYGFPSPFHKIHDPIRIMAKCQHLCYYWYVIWLVVEPPVWKYESQIGMIIPNIFWKI